VCRLRVALRARAHERHVRTVPWRTEPEDDRRLVGGVVGVVELAGVESKNLARSQFHGAVLRVERYGSFLDVECLGLVVVGVVTSREQVARGEGEVVEREPLQS
jgi:hypothetical protein